MRKAGGALIYATIDAVEGDRGIAVTTASSRRGWSGMPTPPAKQGRERRPLSFQARQRSPDLAQREKSRARSTASGRRYSRLFRHFRSWAGERSFRSESLSQRLPSPTRPRCRPSIRRTKSRWQPARVRLCRDHHWSCARRRRRCTFSRSVRS